MVATPKPKGDKYYGRVAEIYNKKRSKQKWWHVEHEEMRSLLSTLPEGLSVVDIPFGTGRFVPLYTDRGFKVSGLEISGHMVAAARKDLGNQFADCDVRIGSAMDVPFDSESFDLVVSTRFLSNIVTYADARKALYEFNRISRRYGILQLGHNIGETVQPDPNQTMDTIMSKKAVDDLLGEFGFKILERRLVLEGPAEGGQMHHILCEKT
ncbi:MAG: class I SAM-dependent methyltransferase [Pseudomonadota bacterium]